MPEIHIADHRVAGIGIDLHGVFVVVGVLKLNSIDIYSLKNASGITQMPVGIIDVVLFGGILANLLHKPGIGNFDGFGFGNLLLLGCGKIGRNEENGADDGRNGEQAAYNDPDRAEKGLAVESPAGPLDGFDFSLFNSRIGQSGAS